MSKNQIPIIYYHSVAPSKHKTWFKNYLTLELKFFELHLKYFSDRNYKFIGLDEYFNVSDNYLAKQKYVCLTFDDGYADNFIYAYPLLKKYKAKAVIFVNPLFADGRSMIRKTLEDYWNSKASLNGIDYWGFLSWDEMRIMEKSGLIDIQSHTLTHTKYFVSDKIIGFHYPGRDCLYPIGNIYPEKLPFYIGNENFEKLLPYGYPFFEQQSSVIAQKVEINPSFSQSIIPSFTNFDWTQQYDFQKMFNQVRAIYEENKKSNSIILKKESDDEYKRRVIFELSESKRIIEQELSKNVKYCCWPHGDNNHFTHSAALDIGYKATTSGKFESADNIIDKTRIETRIGLSKVKNSPLLTKLKINYKVKSRENIFPYSTLSSIYNKLRY